MKRNKRYMLALIILGALGFMSQPPLAEACEIMMQTSNRVQAYSDEHGVSQIVVLKEAEIEAFFQHNSVEHYAYLDLNEVEEELIPVILEARNRIIFENSWVAEGTNGWVTDKEGKVVEVLPHFHEIFPEDWEVPCFPPEYNAG